jgi:PelA/Pel-15E family pectate lyase
MNLRLTAVLVLLMLAPSLAAYTTVSTMLTKPAEFYSSDEAKRLADNILTFQTEVGSWPKNIETAQKPYEGDSKKLSGTFDNGGTTFEMYFLAKVAHATREQKYVDSFNKALDLILKAQYDNGGWPQSYPLHQGQDGYDHYITYNDGAMARLMFLLRDVYTSEVYSFVTPEKKQLCRTAFDKGIDCILKTQVKVNGKLTSWCAQHDDKTLEPRAARKFEPVGLSACEIVGILHLLMVIEKPSPEVVASVDGAVAWLNEVKVTGIKIEDRPNKDLPKGFERFVVKDDKAPAIWARFYEIGTNRPIFGDRDGSVHYDLMEISHERRNGYSWYKGWPRNLVEKEYPEWKKKIDAQQAPATQPK